jgi:hypothetical protein
MHNVQEIEVAVSGLSKSDLISFRDWFEKFDQTAWDSQFEKDVKAGKLDELANQAIADFEAGKCREI